MTPPSRATNTDTDMSDNEAEPGLVSGSEALDISNAQRYNYCGVSKVLAASRL